MPVQRGASRTINTREESREQTIPRRRPKKARSAELEDPTYASTPEKREKARKRAVLDEALSQLPFYGEKAKIGSGLGPTAPTSSEVSHYKKFLTKTYNMVVRKEYDLFFREDAEGWVSFCWGACGRAGGGASWVGV
jgi:hypothetical protein